MPDSAIQIASAADMAAVRQLCRDYRALLAERNSGLSDVVESYYKADAYEDLLKYLPALHSRPDGAIYVGTLDGEVVACGMTHRIDERTCEIKRVFVADYARGHGLGKQLCLTAMKFAKVDGYDRMVLDTMRVLPEAIALYRGLGFTECEPFYDLNPKYAGEIQFFGRDL